MNRQLSSAESALFSSLICHHNAFEAMRTQRDKLVARCNELYRQQCVDKHVTKTDDPMVATIMEAR